jgi:hypothetical protein
MTPIERRAYMRAWRSNKGPCAIDDCDGLYLALGLCQRHYKRLRKYGDPLGAPEPRERYQKAPKPPRAAPRFKICLSHAHYRAGCPLCQAGARMRNRAYLASPEPAERKRASKRGRDRRGERRSAESRAKANVATNRKYAALPADRRGEPWTPEEVALVMSNEISVVARAAILCRPPSQLYKMRHKIRSAEPTR